MIPYVVGVVLALVAVAAVIVDLTYRAHLNDLGPIRHARRGRPQSDPLPVPLGDQGPPSLFEPAPRWPQLFDGGPP